jgi:hypothetical protein
MKMRPPKKVAEYLTAADAADGLEELAANIRARAEHRPLVKWSLSLWYWNPRWLTNDPGTDRIVLNVSYTGARQPEGVSQK